MTQTEFIKGYCERSKITEEELNELGQFAILCECGVGCPGWAIVSKDCLQAQIDLFLTNN